MMQQLKEYIINDTNSTVLVDELMKKHTTYGIGGPAEVFVLPSNKEDLIKVFEISKRANQKINVIFSLVCLMNQPRIWNRKNITNYLEIYIKSEIPL